MRNRPKAVIDTNIFISGWFGDNVHCQSVLEMIYDRKIQLLFSQDTIGELVYITKNAVRHSMDDVNQRLTFLCHLMELFYYSTSINTVNVGDKIQIKCDDPYDDMLLECAYYGKANFLVSDDFRSGMHRIEIKGLDIVSSQEFVNIVL